MTRLRSLLHARRWLALATIVAALAVRIVVPAGMMPAFGANGRGLIVCPGHAMAMPGMAMPGMAMPAKGGVAPSDADKSTGKADAPCAFTGLIAAALDTAALPPLPVLPQPAGILLIVVPLAVAARALRLRPPLRGPPGLGRA